MFTRQDIELAEIKREMAYYDALPPLFRKYLAEHPLGINPVAVYKMLEKYESHLVLRFLKSKTELFLA